MQVFQFLLYLIAVVSANADHCAMLCKSSAWRKVSSDRDEGLHV